MKITDVEVIEFRTRTREHRTRWGKERWGEETNATSSITKISTDEGVSGYMEGGSKAVIEGTVRPMLLGEDPLEREKLWGWMDQMTTSRAKLTERDMGVVDCALWDLLGRMTGMPVHKLLGGATGTGQGVCGLGVEPRARRRSMRSTPSPARRRGTRRTRSTRTSSGTRTGGSPPRSSPASPRRTWRSARPSGTRSAAT